MKMIVHSNTQEAILIGVETWLSFTDEVIGKRIKNIIKELEKQDAR